MNIRNFEDLIDAIYLRKVAFLATFFVIFLLSYGLLAWFDLLPEPVAPKAPEVEQTQLAETGLIESPDSVLATSTVETPAPVIDQGPLLPNKLVIDRFERTIEVLNPESNLVADLDAALLHGAVRHPDSATMDREGSVFILAHSSYLPSVLNKNFQAFNGIQNLKFGDTVRLEAEGFEYVYRVDKVYKAKAEDATIAIAGNTKRLILATCNSFGSKDDRYIVEAELVEVISLDNSQDLTKAI